MWTNFDNEDSYVQVFINNSYYFDFTIVNVPFMRSNLIDLLRNWYDIASVTSRNICSSPLLPVIYLSCSQPIVGVVPLSNRIVCLSSTYSFWSPLQIFHIQIHLRWDWLLSGKLINKGYTATDWLLSGKLINKGYTATGCLELNHHFRNDMVVVIVGQSVWHSSVLINSRRVSCEYDSDWFTGFGK